MNKNSTSLESDDFDEYSEISATDLESAIHRRNFVEVPQKQSINLMLDADIIAWFKKIRRSRISVTYQCGIKRCYLA